MDMGVWVTFEVWLHKIAWGETVDCLQEPQCSMARVRVWEQEVEPPETDEENQEHGEGQAPGERRLNVAELQSQMSPEICWVWD